MVRMKVACPACRVEGEVEMEEYGSWDDLDSEMTLACPRCEKTILLMPGKGVVECAVVRERKDGGIVRDNQYLQVAVEQDGK